VHIGAVSAYYALRRDNLVRPMFTGRKRLPAGASDPSAASASMALALGILAACAFVVWWLVTRL
jgi:hypothetical protein